MADRSCEVSDFLVQGEPVRAGLVVVVDVNHSEPTADADVFSAYLKCRVAQASPFNFNRLVVPQVPLKYGISSHSKQFVGIPSEPHIHQLIICQQTTRIRVLVVEDADFITRKQQFVVGLFGKSEVFIFFVVTQKGTRDESYLFLDRVHNGQVLSESTAVDLPSTVETSCEGQLVDENVLFNIYLELWVVFLVIYLEYLKFLVKTTCKKNIAIPVHPRHNRLMLLSCPSNMLYCRVFVFFMVFHYIVFLLIEVIFNVHLLLSITNLGPVFQLELFLIKVLQLFLVLLLVCLF